MIEGITGEYWEIAESRENTKQEGKRDGNEEA